MSNELTKSEKLIRQVGEGWLANPAGKQGFEIIVLEKSGSTGEQYYASLKPGQRLKLSERLFGSYRVLEVDIRKGKLLNFSQSFNSKNRGRSIEVQLTVYYHVQNAALVAMETFDPLQRLRNTIISTLNTELMQYTESEITPTLIKRIVSNIGHLQSIGLVVEDADVIQFSGDKRITEGTIAEENRVAEARHQKESHISSLAAAEQQQRSQIKIEEERQQAQIRTHEDRTKRIDLLNLNSFLHAHPELANTVFTSFTERDRALLEANLQVAGPLLTAYVEQKKENEEELDPREMLNIFQEAVSTTHVTTPKRRIAWGDSGAESQPALSNNIIDHPPISTSESPPPPTKHKTEDKPKKRIDFGN